jgi:PAS domain S-box-containing protein
MHQEADQYQNIKEKIFNSILLVFIVFVLPLLVSSVLRFSVTGWIFVYLIQIIVVSLLFTVYFLRNSLSLKVKSIFIVCITLVIALLGIKYFGFIGPGILYFIISILISNLFIGRKIGYYIIVIAALAFLLFGYFFISGKLVYDFDVMNFLHLPFSWISYGLVLFPVILIIIITVNKFEDAYQFLIKDRIKKEDNYRSIFEQAADGIIIYDNQGNILMSNNSFSKASGYQTEELKKMNISDFFDADQQNNNPIRFDLLEKGEIVVSERKVVKKDKTIIDIESSSLKLADGRIQSFIRDITEKKRMQIEIYIAGINAEEQERGRLAKDLHDGLGPLLSACRIYLHKIKNKGINDTDSLNKLEEIIDESLSEIKEISNNISPHILRNFGLIHALKSFIEKIADKCEIDIICSCEPSERFDEIIEATIYRVLTELINNTIKYAKVRKASILLKKENDQLYIEYKDEGIGFDCNETLNKNPGVGLLNIKSRIESIGGNYKFLSEPGKGVFIRIIINTK